MNDDDNVYHYVSLFFHLTDVDEKFLRYYASITNVTKKFLNKRNA